MEFQELLKLLLRKKYYLLIVPIISGLMAFVFRFNSDRKYVTESQISTGLTLTMDFAGEKSTVNPFEMSLSFSNITENMASKSVVTRLGYKLLFHDLSSDQPFRQPETEKVELIGLDAETTEIVLKELKSAINNFILISRTSESSKVVYNLLEIYEYEVINFLEGVYIHRVGNTDFINIRFSSEVPKLSAHVVNEWAACFIEYYNFQKSNRLNESLEVLSQILNDKQRVLNTSTEKLSRYKSRYIFLESGSNADPSGELKGLIREKESAIRNLNYRLQNVRTKITEQDKSSSYNSRLRIVKLRDELGRLSTKLMAEPGNEHLKDSLETCRNELQAEMYLHTSINSGKKQLDELFEEENELELNYRVALEDLEKLRDQANIERGTVRNLASTKSNLENLENEVDQARNELSKAQDRYNQARSQLLVGSSSLKMSYYGDIPEDPQPRMTIIYTAMGGIVGFVMTAFMVIVLELIDNRIKNPIKFKRCTGFDPNSIIFHDPELDKDFSQIIIGQFNEINKETEIEFLQNLRKMRYYIQRSSGKTFLFTSLREGSGKSFLLTSLAFSLSLIKKNVLIIDTNFRNNNLSESLSKKSKKYSPLAGINVILSKNEIERYDPKPDTKANFIESEVISETLNPYVFLMKSQNIQQSPEEIFSEIDFKRLLGLFRKEFDYIFLEGAALNSYSDTKELSDYADHIITVFSTNDPFTNKDMNSLQFLNENKDKLSLKLLNNVNPADAE